MNRLLNYFLRGLVVTAPIALTLYVCWRVFSTIDRWLGFDIPGVGFALTIALITLIGFLASTLLARSAVAMLDRLLDRLPFVRLLYSSTRDLLNAFVGEQRRFDAPVMVTVFPGSAVQAIGFVTQETMLRFGLAEHVAVYLPQSYNFAGALVVVPREQVRPIDAESSDVMAFVVSGGVASGRADPRVPRPRT
jgi:uncharacterized membrane protein